MITWKLFSNVSLSNNDLTATLPTNQQSTIATGDGVSSGKWYWEIQIQSAGAMIGVTSTTTGGQIWNTVNHRGYTSGAAKWGGTSGSSYGTPYTQGDVISVLLDMDSGTIEFWKNGITQGIAFTDVKSLGIVFPFYGNPAGTSVSSTATACFNRYTFSYAVPQGYKPYEYMSLTLLSSGGKQYSFEKVVKKSVVPVMTSASNSDVEITASAYNSSDFPWKAFDGLVGSSTRPFWYAQSGPPAGGHWLQVKFSSPKVINGISLTSLLVTGTSHSIKDFELYGSNDGVIFEKLYSGTQLNVITKIDYDFENIKAYSYYRLNILSSYNTTSTVGVNEMEIFEKTNRTIYVLDSSDESEFIQYGMEGDILLNGAIVKVKDVIKTNLALSKGKAFEHTINISKRRLDKITLD